jgi:hypothetical protein
MNTKRIKWYWRTLILVMIILFVSYIIYLPLFIPDTPKDIHSIRYAYLGSIIGGLIGGIFTFLGVNITIHQEKKQKYIDQLPHRIVEIDLLEQDIYNFVFNKYEPCIQSISESVDKKKARVELEDLRTLLADNRYTWRKRSVEINNKLYDAMVDLNKGLFNTHDTIRDWVADQHGEVSLQRFLKERNCIFIGTPKEIKTQQEYLDLRDLFKKRRDKMKAEYDSFL